MQLLTLHVEIEGYTLRILSRFLYLRMIGDLTGDVLVGSQFHEKKLLRQNGGEAGIHANYVLICVVKPIGVDAKSENVPVSQN